MPRGLPGTFYQTKLKRRDFAARSKSKYGSLGPAGPVVNVVSRQIIDDPKQKPSPSSSPNLSRPFRPILDHEKQKKESERRFRHFEEMYFRGEGQR